MKLNKKLKRVDIHFRRQRPRSFLSAPKFATFGMSTIHGLPIIPRMLRVNLTNLIGTISFPEPTCLLVLKFDTAVLSKPNFNFPSFSSAY